MLLFRAGGGFKENEGVEYVHRAGEAEDVYDEVGCRYIGI
jgi:hypothetical protein